MTANSAQARFLEIIGNIYECVLDPANWEPTLAGINRELGFGNAALGVVPLHSGVQMLNCAVGFDNDWLSYGNTYRADSVELWGGADRIEQFPLDEPIVASQTAGYRNRHNNRYFCDVLEPRGFLDGVMVTVAREPGLLGYAAFNRHQSAGDIGEAEINSVRILGPHFRRAVTISNLFDLKAIETSTLASAFDQLTCGVVLVERDLTIVHLNAAAETMLASRDPIRSEKGVLTLPVGQAHAALKRAVFEAARDEISGGQRGIGIPARRRDGEPCVVHVMPLRRIEARRGLTQRAIAALFVTPAATAPRMPSDALSLLYDLTPAEIRIFEMITTGMTQATIADYLGIAASTVKTHVLHLFEKTGCQRQIDLLKLATTLSSPI